MVNLTRKKMGLPALDEEFVKSCIGGGGRKLWIKCTADAPERLEEAMSLAGPAYNECVADHSFPYPGVIDTLKALKGKTAHGSGHQQGARRHYEALPREGDA